jgi:hypothetical protein
LSPETPSSSVTTASPTETLTLAACHIQRITLENQKLREELEAATGVARLTPIPSRRLATS